MNNNIFNVYCDESCHLENDRQDVMLLGGVWCPVVDAQKLSKEIKAIMLKHNAKGELKWTKVSLSRKSFYLELLDWFFSKDNLYFRGVVVENKKSLNHECFNEGVHDNFYYKIYFLLLNKILDHEIKSQRVALVQLLLP